MGTINPFHFPWHEPGDCLALLSPPHSLAKLESKNLLMYSSTTISHMPRKGGLRSVTQQKFTPSPHHTCPAGQLESHALHKAESTEQHPTMNHPGALGHKGSEPVFTILVTRELGEQLLVQIVLCVVVWSRLTGLTSVWGFCTSFQRSNAKAGCGAS